MQLSSLVIPVLLLAALLFVVVRASPEDCRARRRVVLLLVLVTLRYHYWRITQTLPPLGSSGAGLVYGFYALEALVGYAALRRRAVFTERNDRQGEVERNLRWYGSAADAPLIDIFIPTYSEEISILKPTILAATAQNYANFRVFVLDDGKRDELQELCANLSVHYLRREDSAHFKSGNLSHAFRHVMSLPDAPSYIAVLDADFVAYPAFLERSLALMKEERVGIVQTPQFFYSPDPFQYAFNARHSWPEDWRVWSFLSASLDAKGFASCCGTSFLIRGEALSQIGGFPVGCILEDALLSARLGSNQWRTVYLHERLSVGRNPESLRDLFKQRSRWARGEMQMLLAPWRELGADVSGSKLALRQRLLVLRGLLHWFAEPLLRIVWLWIPIVYWFTGVAIYPASTWDALLYCVPMLAPPLALMWMSRGAIMPVAGNTSSLLLAPVRLAAGLRELAGGAGPSFEVTLKGATTAKRVICWGPLSWLALTAIGLLSGMAYRALHPWAIAAEAATPARFLIWNLVVSYMALALLLVALVPCFEKPRYRRAERYPYDRRVRFQRGRASGWCQLRDLSLHGARAALPAPVEPGDELTLSLSDDLAVVGRVVRITEASESGIAFHPTRAQESRLVSLILASARCVPQPAQWTLRGLWSSLARHALG